MYIPPGGTYTGCAWALATCVISNAATAAATTSSRSPMLTLPYEDEPDTNLRIADDLLRAYVAAEFR